MPAHETLQHLLDRWEASREQGDIVTPEELCRDQPELLEEIRNIIEALIAMDRIVQPGLASCQPIAGPASAWDSPARGLLQPGSEPVPGYKLIKRLGEGGFGEVWKAEGPGQFDLALKFVRLAGRAGPKEMNALETVKNLHHPNLIAMFGAWQTEEFLIIAMELADRTLLDRFDEARAQGGKGIPAEELHEYFKEIAKGLDFLNQPQRGPDGQHRDGVQHRDIKPQNLLLVGGSVKVGDFGLARLLHHTITGHSGGLTPAYAAPEFFDEETSNQSDQYSVAVTYCHLRSGRLPFNGTAFQIMTGHLTGEPDLTTLPAGEQHVLARALAKRPEERWPSCSRFIEALAGSESVQCPPALPPIAPEKPRSWRTSLRHCQEKATWALVFSAVFALIYGLYVRYRAPEERTKGPVIEEPQRGIVPATSSQRTDSGRARGEGTLALADGRPRLAVLYFQNNSIDKERLGALEKGLCAMMISRLAATGKFHVVERERIQTVFDEIKLNRSRDFDAATAAHIGKLVGAQQLVLGSYFELFQNFRLDARIVEVETGITLAAGSGEGKADQFGAVLQKTLDDLLARHSAGKKQAPGPKTSSGTEVPPLCVSADKVVKFGQALDASDRGESARAGHLLQELLKGEPDFAPARDTLVNLQKRTPRR